VRTRTVVSQAHSFQWLGSFSNWGNGRYRTELRQGLTAIGRYLAAHQLPTELALLRLDGQYGTGTVLADLAGFAYVTRGKDYSVLDHPQVQARLHLPPDQSQRCPESQLARSLYDCPAVPIGSEGVSCRVVVATHPEGSKKSSVGITWDGIVYEFFFSTLPQQAFTTCDVVELYLHRGAFEPVLADEDAELDPDRWCSHSAWGQEAWQIVSQWVWNLRLELGHRLSPTPLRTTEFAPAIPPSSESVATCPPFSLPTAGYGSTHPRHLLENGTLHRSRLSSPARWDPPLSGGAAAAPPGAASRSRWQSAPGVCGQHSRLPSVSTARTVPMGGTCHGKTAPGQCAAASAAGGVLPRCFGAIGVAETTGAPACSSPVSNASRSASRLLPLCHLPRR
jgi:hypothetical protein